MIAYDLCGHTNTSSFTVTVLPGPNCGNTNCIAIYSSNTVVYTCDACTTVPINPTVFDTCCPSVTLVFDPPTNTCFAVNTTTPVKIIASDNCGNSATNYLKVTVLPGLNCGSSNCISIYCTNIVVYTCSNCTTVPFSAWAVDRCCPGAPPALVYSIPGGYCFPQNTVSTIQVTGYDQCGNVATSSFTVTVLPGPNCGGTTPGLNIVGGTNSGNGLIISWPGTNAQLQQSKDLIHWNPVPGATNPPYVVPLSSPTSFYRLRYN